MEIIEPAAVDRSLREQHDIRALVDHQAGEVIGRTKAGTLRLDKRADGLHFEIDPPNTTAGRDILESVKRGDVTGASFEFRVMRPHGERFEQRSGQLARIVSDMVIREISITTYPAYEATDVEVARRSLEMFKAGVGPRLDWLPLRLQAR